MTTDGGYVLTGTTASFGAGGDDIVLIKTGADGAMVWKRTFGGVDADSGCAVRRARDGGCIVAGSTRSAGGGTDVYLVRTDFSGNLLWERTIGGPGSEAGRDVRETREGGFVVAAVTGTPGAGAPDAWLIKADAGGDTLWTRTFGGAGADVGLSVRQTTDRGYIVAGGTTSSGAGGDDAWLIKTDPNGITGIAVGDRAGPPRPAILAIHDLRGRRVRTLLDATLAAGDHRVHRNGRDDEGRTAPSGIYLYRLEAGGFREARKMILAR